MTIFFTIDDISGRGGTERVVANLANAFSPQHSVVIITYHLRLSQISVPLPKNTQIINLEDIYGDFEPKGTIGKLKLCHYINKIIRSNGEKNNVLIANCNVFYPFFKRRDTKYIRLEHYDFKFLHRKYIDKKPLFARIALFNALVILSPRELPLWQKLHNNVRVIPNFLPQIPSQSTDYTQKVVLSVGRMDNGDQKGFLRLLDIWKLVQDKIASQESGKSTNSQSGLPREAKLARNDGVANDLKEWKLVIVGDGILKDEIRAKIHALNLQESIILKPFTKEIEKEYLSASIYAMSSHFEGFPMVLLESISYGLAPISFDIATGPSDIIENHQSGFLIADNDLQDYANKLITLMSDENLRAKFGNDAKRLAGERFSKEAIIKRWQRLFDEI